MTTTEQKQRYAKEIYIALLNLIIAAEYVYSCNEFLEPTSAYKQKVKFHLKGLKPELQKIIDEDFGLLIDKDENAAVMFSLQDGFKNFIEQLGLDKFITHTPAQIAGFGELARKFHSMPEWVLHHNGIKIFDTEKDFKNEN